MQYLLFNIHDKDNVSIISSVKDDGVQTAHQPMYSANVANHHSPLLAALAG
eukprot:m.493585 g.493585  ORF g.493585 m.493585 type:complete len:51 (+) comp21794_c0_seq13:537-689(+)